MNNLYQEKINDYLYNMRNIMYTFEVTKCCGYSVFIPLYKNETLIDLYSRISSHFDNDIITELFFYSPNGERIKIPISKTVICDFIKKYTICNPLKLEPIYPIGLPVVYRLFFDDGHCNSGHCNSEYCNNDPTTRI